jgi:hypothetical protein
MVLLEPEEAKEFMVNLDEGVMQVIQVYQEIAVMLVIQETGGHKETLVHKELLVYGEEEVTLVPLDQEASRDQMGNLVHEVLLALRDRLVHLVQLV